MWWLLALVISVSALSGCSSERVRDQSRNRADEGTPLERGMLDELNGLRTEPETFAKRLESRGIFYKGKELQLPGEEPVATVEGIEALQEAVEAVQELDPRPAVEWSPELAAKAREVGRLIGPKGLTGVPGPLAPEAPQILLSLGAETPDAAIAALVIDDGAADRRNRSRLLDPDLTAAGVACGKHAARGTLCVIVLGARVRRASAVASSLRRAETGAAPANRGR